MRPNDTILADRGFLIEDEAAMRKIQLNIPAFKRGRAQMHPLEIEETRKIANVRIHVERSIGKVYVTYIFYNAIALTIF